MLSASPNILALPESARLDEVRSFCPLARPVVANFQLEPESRRHLRGKYSGAGSRAPLYCLRPPRRCPTLTRAQLPTRRSQPRTPGAASIAAGRIY